MAGSKNSNMIYDLLCIGNYTKDTIISPSGTKYVDGGAMNYSAHAAKRLGLNVAVVTRLAREDQRVVDKFTSYGIDCYPIYTEYSTTMRLEYPTSDPDQRYLSVASTAGSITTLDVENIATRMAVIGSSFRGEVGLEVIQHFKGKKVFIGADMQGFVRVLREKQLVYEPWDEMEIALKSIDVLKSDAVEAKALTGESDIYRAAKIYSHYGPKEVILTHKEGVVLYTNGEFREVGFYPKVMNGRSGRGDTCLGAYMAMRKSQDPYISLIWAAAVTSLKMEKLGPFDRSLDDVQSLIAEIYDHHLII